MPDHLFCFFAWKKASGKTAGPDLDRATQLFGSHNAGQQLLDKARDKNKKKWIKKKALPKSTLMTSALHVMLPFLMLQAQMMSLTLLPPLLLMSNVARFMTSTRDPSANLEVCQLTSLKCQKMMCKMFINNRKS